MKCCSFVCHKYVICNHYCCTLQLWNSWLTCCAQNKEEGSQVSTLEPGGEHDQDTGIVFPCFLFFFSEKEVTYGHIPLLYIPDKIFSSGLTACYLFLSSGEAVPACVVLIVIRDASMQFTWNISESLGGATILLFGASQVMIYCPQQGACRWMSHGVTFLKWP